MAQLHITLNEEEIKALIAEQNPNAFTKLMENSLNAILRAESTAQLGAERYERTDERTGSRNGYRDRTLTTRIGSVVLKYPKHRNGEPFKTMLFENYCRSEAALIVTMAKMVVNGISTRKVAQIMDVN
ncbi:MAG: transposase [Clostridia bacterium]|nr:transposase [Clostridia bacterium]